MPSNSGDVVLLAGVGDAVVMVAATAGGCIELDGVSPWSGDNDISVYCCC